MLINAAMFEQNGHSGYVLKPQIMWDKHDLMFDRFNAFIYVLFYSDAAMLINAAMFEQNGHSGYVLKPQIMWDKHDLMFDRFNPWEKDNEELQATTVTINVSVTV